jgi:hypothetical protein
VVLCGRANLEEETLVFKNCYCLFNVKAINKTAVIAEKLVENPDFCEIRFECT